MAISAQAASAAQPAAAVRSLNGWYDASDSSTITISASTSVSQWIDKSGKGNTLFQTGDVSQPQLTTVSGLQALTFNRTNDTTGTFLTSSATNSPSSTTTFATGSASSSIFVLGAYTGNDFNAEVIVNYGIPDTQQTGRGIRKASDSLLALATLNTANYDVSSTSQWATTPTIVYGSFGVQTAINVNGGALTLHASDVAATPTGTSLYLGQKQGGGGKFWTGPIYEVLIYNSALSDAERQFIEGYLACKWHVQAILPSNHPYASFSGSSCQMLVAGATPSLTLMLGVLPTGPQLPGTDLTYTSSFTNASETIVYDPTISDPVPANTWFKVGTATQSLGATGLTLPPTPVTYSNDGGKAYTYTPVSGGGGAKSGYDANVTNVRWTLSGAIGPAPSVNSGTATYTVRII